MAKKVQKNKKKTIKRSSSIEKTIQEGRQFVQSARKRMRKPVKTKTMMRIVEEGKRAKNKPLKTVKKTKPSKKAKPAKSKIIRKAAPKRKILPIKPARKSQPPPIVPPVANKSIGKAVKLKSSSRDDLAIPAFGFIDVCFCVDATGSMSGELAQVQSTIQAIINNIENKVRTEGLNLRFSIVTYRDHPPQDSTYVTKILDFTDNFEAIKYVKTLNAWGGGDEPEAVHDGLMDCATKLNWAEVVGAPTLRYVFHIADAPPHGSQFKTYESKIGCLCGMQTDQVMRELNKKQIHYRLIKVRKNERVDEMEKVFKNKLANFDSTDIVNAKQINVKVSDMIIHEVIPDFA